MTFNALEHRDVAEVHWMLERLVRFMAIVTFVIGERPQINRMDEWSGLHRRRRIHRVIDHRVTDVAVVRDHLSVVTHVFTVMTTKAAGEIKMPDVIRMRLPIGFHLREKVSLENSLHFSDSALNRRAFL